MSVPAEVVARESAAWVWYPPEATVVDGRGFLLIRWPDYYDLPPSVLRVETGADPQEVLDAAAEQSRRWGADRVTVPVALDAPAGLEQLLIGGGATPYETVDVLAAGLDDLSFDAPQLELRWRVDAQTVREGAEVVREAFGEGATPGDDQIPLLAERNAADLAAGRGSSLVAYLGGRAVGSAGVTVAGPTARLWSGAVLPEARGRGVYRAMLEARVRYAAQHGATMALVKGKVDTSGPILRRAGFAVFGQERTYRLPLPSQE